VKPEEVGDANPKLLKRNLWKGTLNALGLRTRGESKAKKDGGIPALAPSHHR
jgi:hypothetical protein